MKCESNVVGVLFGSLQTPRWSEAGMRKRDGEMFGNHYALYIQIRVNVTEKKKWACVSCSHWDFWTSHSHTLKKNTEQNTTYDFSWFFQISFLLISFIICKYLVTCTTCRWFNKGQVPAFIALWRRNASNQVIDRMWIAWCSVHMAKKQGASFQPCYG